MNTLLAIVFSLPMMMAPALSCFAQAVTDNKSSNDSVLVVSVNANGVVTDELCKGEATFMTIDNEEYIYTDRPYVKVVPSTGCMLKHGESPTSGSQFFKSDFTPANVQNGMSLSAGGSAIIGFAKGDYPRVKYKVGDRFFYLCKPVVVDSTSYEMPVLTEKASTETSIKHDTLFISVTDTLKGILIKKPKYSRFVSITLQNVELVDSTGYENIYLSNPFIDVKDPMRIPINIIGNQVREGDTLTVHFEQMDSTGIINKPHSIQLIVHRVEKNHNDLVTKIVISALALMALLFILFRSKRKRDPEQEPQEMSGVNPEEKSVERTDDSPSGDFQVETPGEVSPSTPVYDSQDVSDAGKGTEPRNNLAFEKPGYLADMIAKLEGGYSVLKNEGDLLRQSFNDLSESLDGRISRSVQDQLVSVKEMIERVNDSLTSGLSIIGGLQTDMGSIVDRLSICEETNVNLKEKSDDFKQAQENTLEDLRNEIKAAFEKQKEQHENEAEDLRVLLQAEMNGIKMEFKEMKSAVKQDQTYVVSAYSDLLARLESQFNVITQHSDSGSPIHYYVSELLSPVNGYPSFRDKAMKALQSGSTFESMFSELRSSLLHDMEYERSWVNNLARLYSYSRVPEYQSIFGYYHSFKKDISDAFILFLGLGTMLGIVDISIPHLLVDTYEMDKYDYENSSLVLPSLYPDYVKHVKPAVIYDLYRIGFSSPDKSAKPTVAYFMNI